MIEQRKAQLDAAKRKLARSEELAKRDTVSLQVLDDDRGSEQAGRASVAAAVAQLAASDAAISSAKAMIVDAEAAVDAPKISRRSRNPATW